MSSVGTNVRERSGESDGALRRAGLDGRVAFALAALTAGAGAILLIDRLGAPEALTGALGLAPALAGIVGVGLAAGAMRVSRFQAAGRAMPAAYAGPAFAALAAGLALPFAPPGATGLAHLAGVAIGLVAVALLIGPLLRAGGAVSPADLVAARWRGTWLPGLAAALSALVAAATLAGALTAAVEAARAASDLGRPAAAALLTVALLAAIAPGGLGGVVWTSATAAACFAGGLVFTLALAARRANLPSFFATDGLFAEGAAQIATWSAGAPFSLLALAGAALGTAALAPLAGPAIASRNARAALRGGALGLAWSAAAAVLVAAAMAVAALSLPRLEAERLDRLPAFARKAAESGALTICGANGPPARVAEACAARPGSRSLVQRGDAAPTGAFLTRGAADAAGLGRGAAALLGAGLAAASLALAAGALHALASLVAQDALRRMRDVSALTSRRLAAARLAGALAALTAGVSVAAIRVDPAAMLTLALGLAAAALAPLLALAPIARASAGAAMFGLLCGAAAGATAWSHAGFAPSAAPAAGGLAGLVAFLVAVATGLALRPRPQDRAAAAALRRFEPLGAPERGA